MNTTSPRCAALIVIAAAFACTTPPQEDPDAATPDPPVPALSAADIGTPCHYDPSTPTNNPTNTCSKSGLTCVIASADGNYGGYGDTLYEAVPIHTRFLSDGSSEGICTLVSNPGQAAPACPTGTAPWLLSSGHTICLRLCSTAADCNRPGYVCDARFMDGTTYNPQTGAISPLTTKFCVPACEEDLLWCTRTFVGLTSGGGLVVAVTDLDGARECVKQSGVCQDVAQRGNGYLGDDCQHSSECRDDFLCIGGSFFGALDDQGFCARSCTLGQPTPASGCVEGESCESFFGFGYCFVDCINGVCPSDRICAPADPGAVGLPEGETWVSSHCIPCELSSLQCGVTPTEDAGSPADGG